MTEITEEKNITQNKKAKHEYFVVQTFEAGIQLQGTEVKALRQNKANLTDGYVKIINDEAWLLSAHIGHYDQGNINNHEPRRSRKLLLHKREIRKLNTKLNEKGLTLIPLRLYFLKGKVKVEIGLCKGKKVFDKREDIKKKDMKRDLDRNVKY